MVVSGVWIYIYGGWWRRGVWLQSGLILLADDSDESEEFDEPDESDESDELDEFDILAWPQSYQARADHSKRSCQPGGTLDLLLMVDILGVQNI